MEPRAKRTRGVFGADADGKFELAIFEVAANDPAVGGRLDEDMARYGNDVG